ncbi:MAG: hypothetical protein CMJ52_08200 [Planctomycetaceae bacterium]|nr:hypothetical protein [Planctomycetaceae bacterium]
MKATLFGASPRTRNMGVNALFASVTAGLVRRMPDLEMTVFDTLTGVREEDFRVDDQEPVAFRFIGFRIGRRVYRPENLRFMQLAAMAGAFGRAVNPGLKAIAESDVVLDVSGGDSFTDMYPDNRIDAVAGCKELVLDYGRPLLLLPQTYGPFNASMDRASRIVRRSVACFARDERSFANLKAMLGDEFDEDRHKCGVDMAFGLVARDPGPALDPGIRSWIDDGAPTIGFNPSGLIGNVPGVDREKYGFRSDYRATVIEFLTRILDETETRVLLVPHVMSPRGGSESDLDICEQLERSMTERFPGRVRVGSTNFDQCEVKWVISKMDWFCGTRMHATIAGLSTEVPTSTISYSDKALGVFETCGQGSEVFDPRALETEEIVEGLMDSYRRRNETRARLADSIPVVKGKAAEQMDDIASVVESLGAR